MLATFNGAPVITGELTMPRIGRWQACADLDTDVDIGDRCTIDWGGLRLSGTMASGGLYGAKFSCRIVGGAGGLGRDMPAHGFRRAMVSTILQRIMDASGEVLDPGIETGVLSSVLDWYAIPGGGSAGLALSRLAMHLGLAWRVTPSGKVWLGDGQGRWSPDHRCPPGFRNHVGHGRRRFRHPSGDASRRHPDRQGRTRHRRG